MALTSGWRFLIQIKVGLFAATSIALMLVGLVACGVPVIRALRIEPIEALRDA
jgi:ABC-type antimicrobial peptide transport system permease subunit